MKLTTAYREQGAGALTGSKHHYLACHVEFSNEERAIAQQRGLYDLSITVPSDTPLPTRGGDFLASVMRVAGLILTPLFLLGSCVQYLRPDKMEGAGIWPVFWLIVGIALFTIGKWKGIKASRREAEPDQTLTLRRLLTNPDFVVHVPNLAIAPGYEEVVRENLAGLAQSIRQSASTAAQQTYEL